jgi:hypothetical protein
MCIAQQQALTNDSILKMVKAGLGEDTIVSMIQSQPGSYTVNPDSMVALKQAGVSDKELAAMVAKGTTQTVSTAAAAPPVDTTAAFYDNLDIGVYLKLKGEWVSVASETVNWKTGGVLKHFASQGMVKEDVNGHLNGASSNTKIFSPVEILIKTQDGVEATDYQLVHLHANSDNREFRTKTGGVFHESGGATKDNVAFEQKKIAKHTYEITFVTPLVAGQYGFLAPGLSNSTASGSTGKAYTFNLAE